MFTKSRIHVANFTVLNLNVFKQSEICQTCSTGESRTFEFGLEFELDFELDFELKIELNAKKIKNKRQKQKKNKNKNWGGVNYMQVTKNDLCIKNIGTQSVQELFFCDSIHRTVYSNDLVKFFWLRCTARKKLGIYDVHTCTMLHR